MSKLKKSAKQVLSGSGDTNINFSDLCRILEIPGLQNRIKGSHHIYYKEGISEIINIQPAGNKAKS
jgi:predicted RNA binding protein YcfA (HicA-like mRNA interferase family)